MIDRLNAALLNELAATRSARAARSCPLRQLTTARLVEVVRHLDALHARALDTAVATSCR